VLGDSSALVVRIRAGSAVRIRQWGKIMAARPTTTAVAEEGHTRRRLHVTFPLPSSPTAPSRSSALAATAAPGLQDLRRPGVSSRRRVYRRNRGGTPDRILAATTLDIDDITTA
jgi:hypothetical protein